MKSLVNIVALSGVISVATIAATPAAAMEKVPAVPSGQQIALHELLLDEKADGVLTYARFRFVTPQIGAALAYTDVEADFAFLCEEFALPIVQSGRDHVDQIVISFASRAVEFGTADPDTTQFFEAFSLQNGTCIWEGF